MFSRNQSLSYILLNNKRHCDLFLEFIALSCNSEVLFVKFPWFLAFFVGLFSDVYIFMWDRVATLEIIVYLSTWLLVCKFLFYSNRNHIFYWTNKHNPFSGHRAYLCRFEDVIFQAIQNIIFNPLCQGSSNFFVLRSHFEKKVFLSGPLMDSLDVNDTFERLITNLKMHFFNGEILHSFANF